METMVSLSAPYTEFTLIIWCNIISFQAFQYDITAKTANEAIRAFTSITAVKAIMVIQDIIVMAVMTVNSFIL